jgi:uroporphyrin-III C-methyltransferase
MGKVYLVGAGPGAPDLLTVRAARLLERADVVFHDALVHPEALAIASRARIVPVGKRCSRISTDQRFINRALVEAAARYDVVVRLKGGDPMVFGRAQEELDALAAHGVDCEVVPGVTAALAAAAELKISLTRRGVSRSVVLATPRIGTEEPPGRWADGVAAADTAVLYMGVGEADLLANTLRQAGMAGRTPVAIVQNASSPACTTLHTTLQDLPQRAAELPPGGPTLLVLGEVLRPASSAEQSGEPGHTAHPPVPHAKLA